jgi:hypothetical protein
MSPPRAAGRPPATPSKSWPTRPAIRSRVWLYYASTRLVPVDTQHNHTCHVVSTIGWPNLGTCWQSQRPQCPAIRRPADRAPSDCETDCAGSAALVRHRRPAWRHTARHRLVSAGTAPRLSEGAGIGARPVKFGTLIPATVFSIPAQSWRTLDGLGMIG